MLFDKAYMYLPNLHCNAQASLYLLKHYLYTYLTKNVICSIYSVQFLRLIYVFSSYLCLNISIKMYSSEIYSFLLISVQWLGQDTCHYN